MSKVLRIVLALAAVLCAAASAQAVDVIVYQQNFNSYGDGTLMTALPGWNTWTNHPWWPGSTVPTIVSGQALVSSSMNMLLDMTDIFSYGNTQARIEFDLLSLQQDTVLFGPGSASGLEMIYPQSIGFQHGASRIYHFNGGFDYGLQVMDVPNSLGPFQWVFDLTKAGNQITWNATYGGNPLLLSQGPHTLTVNDSRGLNTMEWTTLGGAGAAMDNIVITALNATPPPSWHPGDANKDGIVDLQDFGLLKDNFGMTVGAIWDQGDFNADGAIDLQDFGILKDHFGHTTGDNPVTAVPEPASAMLILAASIGLARRKRSR